MKNNIFINNTNIKQDILDNRDYIFTSSYPVTNFPTEVDLRPFTPQIENQLSLSSCTANAGVNALEILLAKANKFTDLSRLFLYYNERINESLYRNGLEDKGAYLRDVFKTCSKYGICKESIWPYVLENVNIKPSEEAYQDAKLRKVEEYQRIAEYTFKLNHQKDTYAIDHTKICLAKGFPVIITLKLSHDFLNIRGPLGNQNYLGSLDKFYKYLYNHAMCIVGYSDELGGFIVENSWGTSWGDNGFFLLKYDVALQDILDAWVCTKFAGIEFKDEWEWADWQKLYDYNTIEYEVYYNDLIDGKFILESTVKGGVKPYSFDKWCLVSTLTSSEDWDYIYAIHPLDNGKCEITLKEPKDNQEYTWLYSVTITDSGTPKFRVRQYFKVTVKPGNKPSPKPIDNDINNSNIQDNDTNDDINIDSQNNNIQNNTQDNNIQNDIQNNTNNNLNNNQKEIQNDSNIQDNNITIDNKITHDDHNKNKKKDKKEFKDYIPYIIGGIGILAIIIFSII